MSNDALSTSIIDSIQDRKGHNITIVDMSHIEAAPTSEFIIVEGNSNTQVTSIADHIRENVQEQTGVKPYNYDGYNNAQWIVIDYGSTLVHVFQREERLRYNLEELWNDALITHIEDID